MTLYRLTADFEHFWTPVDAEFVEGRLEGLESLARNEEYFDDVPLSSTWTPRRVLFDDVDGTLGDFSAYRTTPAFSGRAVAALRDLLEPNGELLPTVCPTHELWIYKVLRFVDVLDEARSDIDWFPQTASNRHLPRHARKIRRYELIDDREPDAAIFKLRQRPIIDVYVNEEFRRRVEEAGLLGFKFTQVWPTPDDSAARRYFLEKRRRKKGRVREKKRSKEE